MGGTDYVWYECGMCGSALLSVGDGRWAYQKITRPGREHLLRKPMTVSDLRRLLPEPAPPRLAAAATGPERRAPARPAPLPVTPRVEPAPPRPEPFPRIEAAPRVPESHRRVEPAPPKPEPTPLVEQEPTGIDALRAALHTVDAVPPSAMAEAPGESATTSLPFPFVAAAVALLVLLLVGLGLIVLVVLWPT